MVGKHSLPRALGVQRTSINQGPCGSLGIRSRQKIQLLLGPVKLTGKQQKLEQERTALGVERIGFQLFAKRFDGLPQSSFAVQRKWCHCLLAGLVALGVVSHRAGRLGNALLVLRAVLYLDLVVTE
jgi:hypothetical protein